MVEIKVDILGYERARAPDILESGGLGPCIAVGAIYGDQGYMVHCLSVNSELIPLDNLLSDLRKNVQDLDNLRIYIAGAGIDSNDEYEREIMAGRKKTLDKITDAGYRERVIIKWAKGDSIQELILDLSKGEVIYEETLLEDIL